MNINYKSQSGQDKWIVEQLFRGMTHGYFVDIGAGDGEIISNTFVLEKDLHWDGICIEPHDETFKLLQSKRSCTLYNKLIMDYNGEIDFNNVVNDGYYMPYFSSVNIPTQYNNYITIKKQCETLFTALNVLKSSTLIHYLSIDTEGSEYNILKKFFEEEYVVGGPVWKRRIISLSIEHNNIPEYRDKIFNLMTENNYSRVATLGVDDIYVHQIYDIMAL